MKKDRQVFDGRESFTAERRGEEERPLVNTKVQVRSHYYGRLAVEN
jgi:hypothetical protein